jgi:hypothetical protein
MSKVIEVREDQKVINIKLPNGTLIDINNYGNKGANIYIRHHNTCLLDKIKLSEYTDYKHLSDEVTLSSCKTTFREGENVTTVKHTAFNE